MRTYNFEQHKKIIQHKIILEMNIPIIKVNIIKLYPICPNTPFKDTIGLPPINMLLLFIKYIHINPSVIINTYVESLN